MSLSGALSALADEEGRPVAPRITLSDMAGGGLMAVAGILGALLDAKGRGQGRFVDISMTGSLVSMQGLRLAEELFEGERAPQTAAVPPDNDYEFGVYATSDDKYISLDPYEARFKTRLWAIIEEEGAGRRPTVPLNRETVRAALTSAIRARPAARWMELLSSEDVCYAPVLALDELRSDPGFRAAYAQTARRAHTEEPPRLESPLVYEPRALKRPLPRAPHLGEHTRTALLRVGWASTDIQAAEQSGAIECLDGS